MRLRRIVSNVLIIILPFISVAAFAAPNDPGFNPQQKTAIEKIVRDYLIQNPEILVEVSQALQQKEQQQMMHRGEEAIPNYAKQLFDNPDSPVVGNRDGQVTVVEFFDYQCVHCRHMASVMESLMKHDKNVRIVYKEFPIFGAGSEFAAKAALASQKQGKYLAFHNALMHAKQPLTNDKVLSVAKSVGLNTKTLQKEMKSKAVLAELKQNYRLAQALGVIGTPAFVVADHPFTGKLKPYFIPGRVSETVLQGLIDKISKK